MRLISLESNRASFKTVHFNRRGLTLIVGRHRNREAVDLKKTYNGVGKSLIVALIHYCLGSNKNKELDTHLPGWAFTLTFEHEGRTHRSSRETGAPKVALDGRKMGVKQLREELSSLGIFQFPEGSLVSPTFRSLICFFLRPNNAAYVEWDEANGDWTPYQRVFYQTFLLGLDYARVVKKHDQKTALDAFQEAAKRYQGDRELRQFYLGEQDPQIELMQLKKEMSRVAGELASFTVSSNYADRQRRADELHSQHAALSNQTVLEENLRNDLEMSLRIRPDVTPERVNTLFREAEVALPELVRKRLDDVLEFQMRLQENRRRHLAEEIAAVNVRLADLADQRAAIKSQIEEELRYINSHRSLDEYAASSQVLLELRGREQRIQDYLKLLSRYTEEAQRVRAEMAAETLETSQYLRSIDAQVSVLMEAFREHAVELYGSVSAGLTVKNNDGENQCRYDIRAHIQNDTADGINQGKIFCYDLLLLRRKERHNVEFLFHDNRLFADMDKNQRYSLFRLAATVCQGADTQYIATVNEDVLDSVRSIAGEDYEKMFAKAVVLELTDAPGGAGKLLGIQVDMDYDRRPDR